MFLIVLNEKKKSMKLKYNLKEKALKILSGFYINSDVNVNHYCNQHRVKNPNLSYFTDLNM